jgi:hypothetical protein
VHGVWEVGPVDAWVVSLLLEHLVSLVSARWNMVGVGRGQIEGLRNRRDRHSEGHKKEARWMEVGIKREESGRVE